jgi:hypothetical protein
LSVRLIVWEETAKDFQKHTFQIKFFFKMEEKLNLNPFYLNIEYWIAYGIKDIGKRRKKNGFLCILF